MRSPSFINYWLTTFGTAACCVGASISQRAWAAYVRCGFAQSHAQPQRHPHDVIGTMPPGRFVGYLEEFPCHEAGTREEDAIEIESTHTIDIDSFVPRTEIDRRFFDTPYYITPNDPVGQDAAGRGRSPGGTRITPRRHLHDLGDPPAGSRPRNRDPGLRSSKAGIVSILAGN